MDSNAGVPVNKYALSQCLIIRDIVKLNEDVPDAMLAARL